MAQRDKDRVGEGRRGRERNQTGWKPTGRSREKLDSQREQEEKEAVGLLLVGLSRRHGHSMLPQAARSILLMPQPSLCAQEEP